MLAGLTDVASAATITSVNKAALQDVTINVAIAYPAPPKAMLAAFTKATGIKVNYSYIQWDDLQTKIAAAAEAHTYFADVADVDWSKVGEYYRQSGLRRSTSTSMWHLCRRSTPRLLRLSGTASSWPCRATPRCWLPT